MSVKFRTCCVSALALVVIVLTGHAANAQCVSGQTTASKPPSVDANGYLMTIPCAAGTTKPAPAAHAPLTPITLAAGAGSVVVAAGQIVTGCDLSFTGGGPFTLAYTAAGAPGTVTASATVGLMISAGQTYHCPTAAPAQGISIWNTSGLTAGVIAEDAY